MPPGITAAPPRVHAVQLEIAQRTYLASEDPPWPVDPLRIGQLRHVVDNPTGSGRELALVGHHANRAALAVDALYRCRQDETLEVNDR